ncbi:helix-turn-helix domain-containing protein [Metasolibacillus meyeri]|uniref:Helix-turn-helix domain-containing protein n=1 Tax=Metasolibacillus meyeri TaxID=1071052 RepID=A0AAW9NWT2_9BACL|nr:helix-turn-helix domain-containing protein [Metasolibacillus meyeri]MEC1179125.1 helix-turn-helix domain-containing protein [Metasolibacillus meyeri]
MIFQQILLAIFLKLNNERTVASAYHLLRGKRSGQTIQDVGIFSLHCYFSVLPKLSRKTFDEFVEKLIAAGYLHMEETGYYTLTASGMTQAQQGAPCTFAGWHYRGNEHIFYARLSLIVQALSHQSAHIKAFIPIQRDEAIQSFVRQFLVRHQYQSGALQVLLLQEITNSLQTLTVTEEQRELLINRLTGVDLPGFTWQQLAHQAGRTEMDMQLLYISALHQWLEQVAQYPYLADIAQQLRIEMPLTESAYQTAKLFEQGFSLEQIAYRRNLKQSTIEDHFVELAMNDVTFPIEYFVKQEELVQVQHAVSTYATKKLKVLREALPHLSYFQLRLALARGGN